MDDDDLRRGRPTCHVQYGEDVAILAGDALYAEAFRLVLHEQDGGARARSCAAVAELADATGANGMVGGQFIDVLGDVEDLRRMHELKTGRLIARVGGVRTPAGGQPRPIAYTQRVPCLRS